MKRIFLLLFAALPAAIGSLSAQITLNSNNFPVGGLHINRGYCFASPAALGSAGGNQFYDFTGITPLYHDTVIYYPAAQTPWGSFHPGAMVADAETGSGLIRINYYTADASTFRKTGITLIGDFSQGLDTVHGEYSLQDTIISDDYAYGYSRTEYALATITNILPFANYKTWTKKDILVDGWGALQTPLNYYPDVLRVKYAERTFDTVFFFGSPIYTAKGSSFYYKYYAAGVRHPVVKAYTDSLYALQYIEYIYTPPLILGCTDPMALNYNPLANQGDGSCVYCNVNYTITPDATICQGASLTLTATGGGSYLWCDGSTTPGITVSPQHSAIYSVYISPAPDCHALASVEVTVDEPVTAAFWTPQANYGAYATVQFVNLSENAGYYQWDFDDPVNGTSTLEYPLHVYADTGVKIVKLIAGNTCYADSTQDTLYIYSTAAVDITEVPGPVMIYPNPCGNACVVEGSISEASAVEIVVYDMPGRRLFAESREMPPGRFRVELDMSRLPAGIHLIGLRTKDYSINKKVIKAQ